MSDKTYTTPGGESFVVKRQPGGNLQVAKAGEKDSFVAKIESKESLIDSSTKRVHLSDEGSRKLFWVYARRNKRVVSWLGGSMELDAADLSEGSGTGGGSIKPLKLTMPGKVLSVKVKEGDLVEPGQGLIIVEAMKMENLLSSASKAKVAKVHVKEGDRLESGATLITFGAAD